MKLLDEFYEVLEDPYGYGKKLKDEKNRKIIGFFCSYTPEEIIHAAGLHPMRLFGARGDITIADAHFQAYCCSLVRGALEEALSGNLNFLDGTVFPHTCDSIQRLSDVWRLNTSFSFFADVVLPVKLNTDSARRYMTDVLNRFRNDLEKGFGVKIGNDRLAGSIATYNRIRTCLEEIYGLHSDNPGIISGSDLYTVIRASMLMDRDDLAEKLPQVAEGIRRGDVATGADGKKRILLTGSVCDHPDVYRILEESGGTVVWDDLCTGSRYFSGMIDQRDDPVESLADRYLNRVVCPAKHVSPVSRGEHLLNLVKEKKADGVIFLLLKFCDPHAFDYPYLKEWFDREGIPSMVLEIEDRLPSKGQLLTRFETFIHMM
ncbi:MAG: 2-hydroxyacyl-CoA dehydratase [Deltaproteobacteria bacterium]|nr:2-hydroxyacyl-CoA dehydratase [Deltaproteobacteria bacterium]